MTTQPEALRLAAELDAEIQRTVQLDMMHHNAAAKLRRLAAVEAQRDALLEALKEAMGGYTEFSAGDRELLRKCRAAIKAVEGEKT